MRHIQTAVVTGATSFLGSAVTRALLRQGCEVYGLVRPSSRSRAMLPVHERFHELLTDLTDTERWTKAVGVADSFFHFAWGGPGIQGRSDPVVHRESAELALSCLRAAASLGVSRFYLSGSQAEYGPTVGRITEETPCRPVLEYGKNKLRVARLAPALAASLGMEYVHARYFSLYGPNDHPYTLVPSCIRAFLSDERMELSECTNMWNFLHVEDAAEATLLLAECELPEPSVLVNLAGPDTRVLRSFVEEIHSLCGGRGVCAFGARQVSERPVDNWPETGKLHSLIDWSPRISFSEGVGALIAAEQAKRSGEAV